jgi:hypothetical protein
MKQSIVRSDPTWATREIGWLLIVIATTIQIARVVGMTAAHGELPFLSANDRSRWSAMAALNEEGRWEIDNVIEIMDSKGKSRIWNTIDMVRHRGRDNREHYYSSKPPLLTVMLAAVAKPISMLTGMKLTHEPFLIGRIVMILVNVIPLFLWWLWLHRWLEREVKDSWSRLILLNMGLWGTFLTTFSGTINNHLQGALFFTVSLALVWQIVDAARGNRNTSWVTWGMCGLASGMTVACELPALSWAVVTAIALLLIDWRRFLLGYGSGAALIAVAFLGCNLWANQDLRPPYSHRVLGAMIGSIPKSGDETAPAIADVMALANKNEHDRKNDRDSGSIDRCTAVH